MKNLLGLLVIAGLFVIVGCGEPAKPVKKDDKPAPAPSAPEKKDDKKPADAPKP